MAFSGLCCSLARLPLAIKSFVFLEIFKKTAQPGKIKLFSINTCQRNTAFYAAINTHRVAARTRMGLL
jgi:hypothetical protein